jgi:putative ABC transport system permease protein
MPASRRIEEDRPVNIISFADSVGRDLRYALRGFARRPAFTFAAVFTLALGLGATTAIFSVVYSVLIKPLPYPNADELVRIKHLVRPGGNTDLTTAPSMYFTYRDENRTLAEIGLWWEAGMTLTGLGDPERVRGVFVSHGTLQALGVRPLLGRWFTEAEHGRAADGAAPVILSHAFWQRRFGGDAAALGRVLTLDSRLSQVVGVMPRDFRFLDATLQPDVIFGGTGLDPAEQILDNFLYHALARLKPGVTPAEAQADLARMVPIWLDAWPLRPGVTYTRDAYAQVTPIVRLLKDELVGGVASTLWVLMGAIGAVLLVACANIANLMLTRADARRQELAVRAALGAAPARIARELLVESAGLGAAGGLLGLLLAYGGVEALVAMGPRNLPRLQEISVYPPVLAFTVVVSLAATIVFGSITAWRHALRVDMPAIGAARGASTSRERSTMRGALVVAQVALALVLVVGAALMIRTFQELRNVDPGFSDPATIQTARIWMPFAEVFGDPVRNTGMLREMLERVEALPGVASAGVTSTLPMEELLRRGGVVVDGQPQAAADALPQRRWKLVSPGYLEAMGTRLIAGRDVTWTDIEAGGRVALISEDFARELAAGPADALGLRIRAPVEQDSWREVIGVVQNVREAGLYEAPPSIVYWPVLMENFVGRTAFGTDLAAFAIRSERAGTATFVEEIRQTIWSVNANVPVASDGTMQDLYADSLARTSFTLVLLGIAGGMALLLGIIGIYGVIAYVVSQRAREIGIRSALGAEPQQLKTMFLRQGLALSAMGAVIGLVAAMALGRLMSSLLFGVSPMDPIAYVAAVAVTIAAAALASYVPARRAATIDPIETLRAE